VRIEKIRNRTLRQLVYDQLREKIICAEILPGENISLRDLAERFGVSLMPVREALWQLESENVIVIESNKGMRVNNLTPSQMEEVLRIRLVLETMAVERACDLRPASALPKLDRLLSDMNGCVQNAKKYLGKNSQFHFTLYALAESPMLLEIIDRLWARIGPYLYIHTHEPENLSVAMGYHQAIFEALVKRDKKEIVQALRGDMETAAHIIKPFLIASDRETQEGVPLSVMNGAIPESR